MALKIFALNCSLKGGDEPSSTDRLLGELIAELGKHGATGEIAGSVWTSKIAGAVAAGFAAVNIFGGFLVTQRMLAMYKKKDKPAGKGH